MRKKGTYYLTWRMRTGFHLLAALDAIPGWKVPENYCPRWRLVTHFHFTPY